MSVYQEYCEESFDEKGRLTRFTLKYPDNFNFGYDVVDKIADRAPDKRALVWCNVQGEEHTFSFGDIKGPAIRWPMCSAPLASAGATG